MLDVCAKGLQPGRRARRAHLHLAGIACFGLAAASSPVEGAFGYRKPLTIQGARVSGAPHANFPVLIRLIDPNLRATPAGRVTSPNGSDIAFMASNGALLDHEIERYDGATGTLVAWVRIPSLPAADTTIFLYYGDREIVCPQNNRRAVWDTSFRYVYHFAETAGDPADSTSNAMVATRNPNGDPTAVQTPNVTGPIGPALDLTSPPTTPPPPFTVGPPATDTHVSIADGTLAASSPLTMEAWVSFDTVPSPAAFVGIVAKGRESGTNWVGIDRMDGGQATFIWPCCGSGPGNLDGTTVLGTGTWYYVAATFDGVSQRAIYVNGLPENTSATAFAYAANALPTRVGDDSNGNWMDGQVDEVRFSNVARSAGWIQTTYDNASCPSTSTCGVAANRFVVEGTEQVPPTNYRSIGDTTTPYSTGTVTATLGSAVVTGTGTAWRTANRGRGDSININGTLYTVLSVDSETQLTLTTSAAASFSGAYSINRKFATLAEWEDCIDGGSSPCGPDPAIASSNLVTGDRREVGIVYRDKVYVDAVLPLDDVLVIDGSTTGAFHTITLTADAGNRHNGIPASAGGSGVVLDMGGSAANADGIRISDPFVTVEWMEIRNSGSTSDGIELSGLPATNRTVVRNCIVHDMGAFGIEVQGANHDAAIYNNFFYRNGSSGIRVQSAQNATSSVRVLSNTVFASASASAAGMSGVAPVGGTPVTVSNNISHSNAGGDFGVLGLSTASSNNLAGDATGTTHSPAGGGLDSVPLSGPGGVNFINTTVGFENLHLRTSPPLSAAQDAGADLSCSFRQDIDGVYRLTPWEIGADDVSQTTAVTLLSFDARGLDAAVDLSWTTASELQNLGFHLYRASTAEGPYERITSSLVPGLGSSPVGATYGFRDSGLTNGLTYFYWLEDVETTGQAARHGPISATTQASPVPDPAPGDADGGGGAGGSGNGGGSADRTAHGHPAANALRVVRQDPEGVDIELLTQGFYLTRRNDGSARIELPGFVETARPGSPGLPVRRLWVEALAGRGVTLSDVSASEVESLPDLWPEAALATEIEISPEGTVQLARKKTRPGEEYRRGPAPAWARLLGVAFQGEVKKAQVEMSPLRWDPQSQRLDLARRLRVRLSFAGEAPGERPLGGSKGRKAAVKLARRLPVLARLAVREAGLYRVSFDEIMGSRRGVPSSRLRLSHQGAPVAVHVEPPGEVFGPGSVLYFLSEGASLNPYATEAVYELEEGVEGSSMESGTAFPKGAAVDYSWAEGAWEENKTYQAGLVEADQIWLWQAIVSPSVKTYPFTLSGLAPVPETSKLTVFLQGGSDFEAAPDHHLRARINGLAVGEATWDGKNAFQLQADVPPGLLREGANQLSLESVGDTAAAYSLVFLDRFTLAYPRALLPEGGVFRGRFPSSGAAEIAGLEADSILLDTTGPRPRWLTGATPPAVGLSFAAEAGRAYQAFAAGSLLRPEVRRPGLAVLRSPGAGAEYLLIAPRALLGAAEPLLERRRAQGLAAMAVALEQVWQEFGYGEARPPALKDFLAYAYDRWRPAPRYVLLLGDATFDFKDHLGTGQENLVPPLLVRTSYVWTVSDPAYAAVNGEDELPDIAIGRLPAGNLEEAQRLVAKLLAFEQGGLDLSGRAVLVADNADVAGNFEANTDEIASSLLSGREVEKIYLRDYGSGTRAAIIDSFDRGASLLSYVGHGGVAIWASENVFNNLDVQTLVPQAGQPFVLTMNCLNGYFHMPGLNSLSEELVKAEGKGAVGAFSPSGLSLDGPAHSYHKALLGEIVSGRHERLGDAILAAQAVYADSGQFPELLGIYHLLGDPALPLRP